MITLGIIGIVAAITMPLLIQNYKRQSASIKLKKFYAIMSQALKLSEIDNGLIPEWDKTAIIFDDDGEYDKDANSEVAYAFFEKYLAPYFKYVSAEKDPKYLNYTKVILLDGSVFHIRNGGYYDIIYDTNGSRSPNVLGRDQFWFILVTNKNTNRYFKGFCKNDISVNSRQEAYDMCKNSGSYCTCLLEQDKWEIKEDYPHRL